jgi:hypothetical protein
MVSNHSLQENKASILNVSSPKASQRGEQIHFGGMKLFSSRLNSLLCQGNGDSEGRSHANGAFDRDRAAV